MTAGFFLALGACTANPIVANDPARLERSYWLHASLGMFTQRGYWGPAYPPTIAPSDADIDNAVGLLTGPYGANRLYLVYHKEIADDEARRILRRWRKTCPKEVELVPALVLRMYDKELGFVFTNTELRALTDFFQREINPRRIGVYDVHSGRDQGPALSVLAERYQDGLVRLGLQPDEPVAGPFVAAVEDTWSGFCHGRRNHEDWEQPGFGAEALRRWVEARNAANTPIAWDLVTVAWDYRRTPRGGYPGYDDAEKNDPLPAGRNRLGLRLIRETARPAVLKGFSSDLYILHENSRSAVHDGKAGSFYQTLKEGREYRGYFAVPFREITESFHSLAQGKWPE